MADREMRITLDGDKIQSVKVIELDGSAKASGVEKLIYFLVGIPVLLYVLLHYWLG